jgi:hypothetical protein
MARPLPPIVVGPITPTTPSVQVRAVAPNATVDLLVAGATVGSAGSTAGGTVWVPVASPVVVGQGVTARQSTAGGTSDESAQPVPVVDVPNPLPSPVFVSPLSTCMSRLRLDGLVPGATVLVRQGGTVVGKTVAGQPSDFVAIDAAASLTGGARLQASQEIVVGGTNLVSPAVSSTPILFTNPEQPLPPPGIGQPVLACRTSLDFFGMTPSADVTVDNEGASTNWLNVASAYNGWGAAPLRPGKLVAKQQFPRCNRESAETVVPVGPATAPGQPVIAVKPCPATRKVQLTGLVPGAVVVLSTVVPDPGTPGAVVVTPIGEATASYAGEDFDLPLGVEPVTATGEAVLLTARQTLCGLNSADAVRVGFATPGGPHGAPTITTPFFECARRIPVTGANPASVLQPFHADTNQPIGDAVPATGAEMALRLWFPLAAGRRVLVRQTGCDADGDSPVERATDLPNPLPAPKIAEPVRPKAAGVAVSGCLPGARVHLLVNNVVRKSIDAFIANPTIPTADLALAENDNLWAVQTLCAKESTMEGHATVVKKGNMTVDVQPGTVQRGTTANVTVRARDADTGAQVAGAQVLLNSALVGQTGVAFAFAPALGQANPAGVVKEPVAHNDATFSITLVDPPPPPKGKLYLNVGPTVLIPNQLRLVSASWTVATVWTPVQSFAASSANTSVTLPDPPPAPADRRVSVVLDTTWEVAGTINGIPFAPQQFKGHMNPSPTLLAWAGKDLTAGWLVQWGIEYDDAGNPWLIVVTNYQGAV